MYITNHITIYITISIPWRLRADAFNKENIYYFLFMIPTSRLHKLSISLGKAIVM